MTVLEFFIWFAICYIVGIGLALFFGKFIDKLNEKIK